MDPLDIMLKQDNVIPYYQPIVSADTQLVIGYKVSAFFQEDDQEPQRLDWFFEDSSIPDDFQHELISYIQHKVITDFLKSGQAATLFFRYDAGLLLRDNAETLLAVLESYSDQGLNLNNIVIELKDGFLVEHAASYRPLIMYLKTKGIRIAIDDLGKMNGNLERLVLLKPNIIKIDAAFLKDELPHLYRHVHHALFMLARRIGAILMFKGVTTANQLNYAWRNGARYFQGSYLRRPRPEFVTPDCCQNKVKTDFQHFVNFERKKVKAQLDLTEQINEQFQETLKNVKPGEAYDTIILAVANKCSRHAFRVYICNEEGRQLSSNAVKNNAGNWELHEEGRHKNWSWRPYFFENIIRMNLEKKGILSDLYTDIQKDELIRTFSYPVSNTLFVFLDIPYDYLYEQEGLL